MDSIRQLRGVHDDLQEDNTVLVRTAVAKLFGTIMPRKSETTLQVWSQLIAKVMGDKKMVELLQKYIDVISSNDFIEAILSGHITYTMFKPNVGKALHQQNEVPEDQEEALIQQWCDMFHNRGCEVLAPISLTMTPETYGAFYQGNKERQMGITVAEFPPYTVAPEQNQEKTLWEQIKGGMLSGPITPALVYTSDVAVEQDHGAVQQWRAILGPSNPDRDRDLARFQGSFRSMYAAHSYNTLVHGSGSIFEAQQEVQWFAQRLKELIGNS